MKYFILFSVFFIMSCGAHQKSKDIPFEIIKQSEYGAELPQQQKLIKTRGEFEAKLKEVYATHSDIPELTSIDFDKYDVLLVHLGTYNTGGHNFQVENIGWKGDDLIIKINQNKPNTNMVTMALTNPFAFIKIKKLNQVPNSVHLEK